MQLDRTLFLPMRYSPGFMLGQNPVGLYGLRSGSAFGHLGFLTVLCWADTSRDISVALLNTGKSFAPAMYPRLISLLGALDRACPRVAGRRACPAGGAERKRRTDRRGG